LVVTYNAILNDFGAANNGIACMENDRVGIIADGAAEIALATSFDGSVDRGSYPRRHCY
jgi:hypothetical protein